MNDEFQASEEAIDQTRKVREGEELDTDALDAFFRTHVPGYTGEMAVEQFPGGHSNLTYMIRSQDKEWVLRRPPMGLEIKTAHDMGREFHILSHLQGHYDRIPEMIAFCEDDSVLGAPFYVMERVRGVILRSKEAPPGVELTPEVMGPLSRNTIANLAAIHGVDYRAAGLGELGKPEGYVERQIKGWTKRYKNAQTDDIPEVERAARWLAEHMPNREAGATLIHNDYKYDNLVLDPADLTNILAVLDWEMATIGDPLMDLGTSLSLWVDPDDPPQVHMLPFGPTMLPGNLNRRELVQAYAEASGRNVDDALYYFVYGLFKMAVILQQIYKRYDMGYSKDERFAQMIMGVRIFGLMADLAIDKGRIDRLGA